MSNTETKKHAKLNYMNVFRAIAIIIIVGGHTFGGNCANPFIKKILSEIFENGTALFVFISGFLFQYLSDRFEYVNYLKKKVINIIAPYIITSIIGILILLAFPKLNLFGNLSLFLQIPIFLTTGYYHNGPTWYIPMTTIFFILSAILLKLEKIHIKNYSLLYLLLPLFIIVTIFVPRYQFIDGKTMSIMNYSELYVYLCAIKAIFIRTVHFLSIYILGMFLSAYKNYIGKLYKYRLILFVAMILLSVFSVLAPVHNGTLSKIVLTLILLGYLYHYDEVILKHEKINNCFDIIAKYSFSIFFIHFYLISLTHFIMKYKLHLSDTVLITDLNSFLLWFALTLVKFIVGFFGSLLLCIIAKFALSKIGIKNTRSFIGV